MFQKYFKTVFLSFFPPQSDFLSNTSPEKSKGVNQYFIHPFAYPASTLTQSHQYYRAQFINKESYKDFCLTAQSLHFYVLIQQRKSHVS